MVLVMVAAGAASCAREETAGSAGDIAERGAAESPSGSPPGSGELEDPAGPQHSVTAIVTDIRLSPAAMVQAEKFMCVCGCGMVLAECSCDKEPGGLSMKKHLQDLVDLGLTPQAIADDMAATYGSGVLP